METNVLADAGLITVSFIVDTDYILNNFPDADLNRKSPLRVDAGVLSMLSDLKSVISGYNTRSMKLKANIGDIIVFSAEPKHFIAKECIQVYKIVPWIGRLNILPHKTEDEVAIEDCNKPESKNFMAIVKRKGPEQLEIRFSVFTLAKDGINYDLHGNFYCDLLSLDVT